MERIRLARLTGTVGVAAGVLWLTSWIVEIFFESGEGSASWHTNQVLATVALSGAAVLMYGLARTRSGGDGRAARLFLTLSWVGWALLALGGIGFLAAGDEEPGVVGIVFPIGGTFITLGGLVSGVVIARRQELITWRRWMPLAFAVSLVAADFVQVPSDDNTPATFGAEFVKFSLIVLLGLALRTAGFRSPTTSPRIPATAEVVRVA